MKIYEELECGATIEVKELRTAADAYGTNWPAYADVEFRTEGGAIDDDGYETCFNTLRIPIQLRSIDGLIEALKKIKEQLEQ